MSCIEARDMMLVAEPSELRGRVDSAFTAHLGECSSCRSLASSLAGDMNVLSSRVRARATRRTVMLATVPIAAVLVVAVTILATGRNQPATARLPGADRPANVVSVDVGVGQRATVIKTADPKTTLIWISSGSH
jgi:hypothetical protein